MQIIAIDLKSYYASVECVDRGLDPLTTNLVVADERRTDKTICLAVSPSLKAYGISGRARLFEVRQRIREVNEQRRRQARYQVLNGVSSDANLLKAHPDMEVGFLIARPQMTHYIECSQRIYNIYLKYAAPDDIHVYSIDEVFVDVTNYLKSFNMNAHEMAMTMIRDVLAQTGITATAGIGTNMYLAKIAMDIVAKKMPPDKDGVRIAQLDEMSYRRQLWGHTPLTDFWRVGPGIAKRLKEYGIVTMGQLARASLAYEDSLYRIFGVNAELLIDHAWGWEPATMEQIKAYRPETNSTSSGQVLTEPYSYEKTLVVVQEMAEGVALDLFEKHLETDQLTLTIGYDIENLKNESIRKIYSGPIVTDRYGRQVPKHSHGTANLDQFTASVRLITNAVVDLFKRIANPMLLVRRITLTANRLQAECTYKPKSDVIQLDLFTDYDKVRQEKEAEEQRLAKERRLMQATLQLKKRFGKNALLRGLDFKEGATARQRNKQIGGHNSNI